MACRYRRSHLLSNCLSYWPSSAAATLPVAARRACLSTNVSPPIGFLAPLAGVGRTFLGIEPVISPPSVPGACRSSRLPPSRCGLSLSCINIYGGRRLGRHSLSARRIDCKHQAQLPGSEWSARRKETATSGSIARLVTIHRESSFALLPEIPKNLLRLSNHSSLHQHPRKPPNTTTKHDPIHRLKSRSTAHHGSPYQTDN